MNWDILIKLIIITHYQTFTTLNTLRRSLVQRSTSSSDVSSINIEPLKGFEPKLIQILADVVGSRIDHVFKVIGPNVKLTEKILQNMVKNGEDMPLDGSHRLLCTCTHYIVILSCRTAARETVMSRIFDLINSALSICIIITTLCYRTIVYSGMFVWLYEKGIFSSHRRSFDPKAPHTTQIGLRGVK